MKKKKPRFFCDNCGSEVGKEEKRCPSCGRYFSAIRCPKCGFSGEEARFKNGCPSCGYSSRPPLPREREARGSDENPGFPLWIYAVVIGTLSLTLALLLYIIN